MICLSFYFLPSHRSKVTSPLEVDKDDKQSAGPPIGRDDKQNADDMGCCFSSGQQLSRMEGHSLAPVACKQMCPSLLARTGPGYTVLSLSSLTCGSVPPGVGHLC